MARLPSDKELKVMKEIVAKSGKFAYRDILWALVNSKEFLLRRERDRYEAQRSGTGVVAGNPGSLR